MKRIFLILFFLIFRTTILAKDSYEIYFRDEREEVAKFLQANQQKMQQKASKYHHENDFVTAIVYPELLRYNYILDFIETTSLELIYMRYGSKTADFSIGHFQMKLSFVEKMEAYIKKYPSEFNKYKKMLIVRTASPELQRKLRLSRLKKIDWQLTYLHAFIAICDHKFKSFKFDSSIEKLQFYAACYNIGFHNKYQTIQQNATKNTFPNGPKYLGTQFCYASIACAYYLNPKSMK